MCLIKKKYSVMCLFKKTLFLFGTCISPFLTSENFHCRNIGIGKLGTVNLYKRCILCNYAYFFCVIIHKVCKHCFACSAFSCNYGMSRPAYTAYSPFGFFKNRVQCSAVVYNRVHIVLRFI